MLADYHAAIQSAADSDAPLHGVLRLTAPVVFGRRHVTPVVTAFLDMWPAVRVEMLLSDRNLDLIEEGLDVAVRIGRLADSGLVVRRVGEVRRVLAASPAYLAARGQPRQPDDLAEGTLVRLLDSFELPPLPVQLAVPSVRHMPPRVRAFLDHAARQLGAFAVLT